MKRRPAKRNGRVNIGVTVFIIKECTLLLGLRKNIVGHNLWGLPGGRLEENESIITCGRRELFEETGLTVVVLQVVNVLDDPREDGHWLHYGLRAIYPSNKRPERREPEKCAEWKFFPLEALPPNIFDPHKRLINALLKTVPA